MATLQCKGNHRIIFSLNKHLKGKAHKHFCLVFFRSRKHSNQTWVTLSPCSKDRTLLFIDDTALGKEEQPHPLRFLVFHNTDKLTYSFLVYQKQRMCLMYQPPHFGMKCIPFQFCKMNELLEMC